MSSNARIPLSKQQKFLYALILIGGGWGWQRINRWWADISGAGETEGERRNPTESDFQLSHYSRSIWMFLLYLDAVYKAASLLNFLVFLIDGRYASLITRVLGMRLVFAHPSTVRQVNFEFMNRQLVWHGFTEFLLYLMPLINIDRIRNFVRRRLLPRRKAAASPNLGTQSSINVNENLQEERGRQIIVENSTCQSCQSNPPNVPYITNCGHLYCYFCILLLVHQEGGEAECLVCNQYVSRVSRFQVLS
eukprot:TRINITY_DN222_c0_g1_i1.p1 TRINITY_DN222_c0_g1~~TRINITY_DN222_c0_g1_i1.p1  ORF type:complete len:249 (-),score=21.35 TRINITY_DN222_c0_g1_i1:168-914(-)